MKKILCIVLLVSFSINLFALPIWFCFLTNDGNIYIYQDEIVAPHINDPNSIKNIGMMHLLRLRNMMPNANIQYQDAFFDQGLLNQQLGNWESLYGRGKSISWKTDNSFELYFDRTPYIPSEIGKGTYICFFNTVDHTLIICVRDIPLNQIPAEQSRLLTELMVRLPNATTVQMGGFFTDHNVGDAFIQTHSNRYGHRSIYEWDGGENFTYWFERHRLNVGDRTMDLLEDEEDLIEDRENPWRSEFIKEAYDREVGNRWMVRFSSKRPTYETFANWLFEAQMNRKRGGSGRIELHPEDAARLAQTDRGKLELAKIWEYNERLNEGGVPLTKKEWKTIRNRPLGDYGVVEDDPVDFADVAGSHRFNRTAFNEGFHTNISPYECDPTTMVAEEGSSMTTYQYKLEAYKGEKWLKRMPMGGYYAWFCGILMGAGMVITVVELITNFVHINLPKDDLFQIFHQDNLSPMLENASPMDKANYLKNNPHAWMLKEQGKNQGFSIHNQCTYSQSNLATNFKR